MPLRILVVEDDAATLEFMTEVLRALKVEVQPLSDSEVAATVIDQQKFDGIFLDLRMPGLDGFELSRRIRASSWNRRTPIIVVTGQEEKDTLQQAFAAGATFFLEKPIDRRKLTKLFRTTRSTMLEERQRYRRVSVSTAVECQVGSRTVVGRSVNLSQRGLLLRPCSPLEPGSTMQLSFSLPGQDAVITATGVVVRVDQKNQVGIQFITLGSGDRQRIQEFAGRDPEAS